MYDMFLLGGAHGAAIALVFDEIMAFVGMWYSLSVVFIVCVCLCVCVCVLCMLVLLYRRVGLVLCAAYQHADAYTPLRTITHHTHTHQFGRLFAHQSHSIFI